MSACLQSSNNNNPNVLVPGQPSDQTKALMAALNNPNLASSGAVYGLLSQVAGLVSEKELQLRAEDSSVRAAAGKAAAATTEAQGDAMESGAISQTVASGVGAATEVHSGAQGINHHIDAKTDLETHQNALKELDNKINAHETPTAQTGDNSQVVNHATEATKLKNEKAKLAQTYKVNSEAKSDKHEGKRQLHQATGGVVNALGGVGSAGSNAAKAQADNSSAMLSQVTSDIQSNEKTATDTASQALQLLSSSGDAAKASAGR